MAIIKISCIVITDSAQYNIYLCELVKMINFTG
jgi:hypothetical protein